MRTVGDLMTRDPVVVHSCTPLPICASKLVRHRIRQLPVIDESSGHLRGLLVAQDLFALGRLREGRWLWNADEPSVRRAGDLAVPVEVTAHPGDDIIPTLARQEVTEHRVVVVVDDDERPVGILTQHDGVRLASRMLSAESRRNPNSLTIGDTLSKGRYRLESLIGHGGMARVYRAVDLHTGRDRAIKVLRSEFTGRSAPRFRFEQEARTVAALCHPNIVRVFGVENEAERVFMVMELLERGSIADWLVSYGPLPPRVACSAMIDVLQGLAESHTQGVIHRDVKPRNILLSEEGTAKLADFGIARVSDGSVRHTGTDAALGTESYMAPEQRGCARDADERADVFGAGATLYHLLTGADPFELQIPHRRARLFDGLDAALAIVVQRATRYRPEDRFASAEDMLQTLEAIRDSLPAVPPHTPALGAPTHHETTLTPAPQVTGPRGPTFDPDPRPGRSLSRADTTMPICLSEERTVPLMRRIEPPRMGPGWTVLVFATLVSVFLSAGVVLGMLIAGSSP